MNRIVYVTLFTVSVLSVAECRSDVEVAPAPRAIRADGSRDPVPPPATRENPLELVERIIKNSKVVGDKLAMTDTGVDTQKTQSTILRDIDALLNRHEDPPPPQSDMNQDMNKNMQNPSDPNDQKKNDMMPMGGMDPKDMKDKKDMGMGGGMDQQPMTGERPKGHRPRQQPNDNQPKDTSTNQALNKPDPKPMGGMPPKEPPKKPGGQMPDPRNKTKNPSQPALPFEDDVVKEVWGHLPDKLRQQASQYYRQEFMPRYAELLKLYYASLSEKDKK